MAKNMAAVAARFIGSRMTAIACLLGALPGSSVARAETWALRVSGEGGMGRDLVGASPHGFFGVAVDAPLLARRVEVGGGVRTLLGGIEPRPALAAFISGRICAHEGAWSPALGIELELSTAHAATLAGEPPDSFTREFNAAGRDTRLRAHLSIEPLRFEWDQLLVSAASLRIGTPLDGDPGQRTRLSLTLLRIGWMLSS